MFPLDSRLISQDLPISVIPDELRQWVERGWRLGSDRENYTQDDEDEQDEGGGEEVIELSIRGEAEQAG